MTVQVPPRVQPGARHIVQEQSRISKYRWVICALLFIAIGINYIDRQMIGILKPTLAAELK
ncbi:hypothetical protein [Pseudomonas japonica]|nr:hypothetical protein [Pseudomonas japonica]